MPKEKTTPVVTALPLNPYKDVPEERKSRLNADISTEDFMRMKSISPRHGTIQTIVNLYVRTIILELDAAGVRHYSEDGLTKLRDIIIRHTHPSLVGEIPQGHEPTGAAGVRQPHTNTPSQSADNASGAGPRKGRKGTAKSEGGQS